jgi:pantetheine-phosphate adenylyltransferase
MDKKLLTNPLINEYFNDWHIGSHSASHFADAVIEKFFPRQNIYHSGKHHIWPMLECAMLAPLQNDADVENQFVAYFFALFHDADQSSINVSREILNRHVNMNADPKWQRLFQMVHEAIQATEYNFEDIDLLEDHVKHCIMLDVGPLNDTDLGSILRNERLIFKEYQNVEYTAFANKRIDVLRNIYKICKLNPNALRIRENHLIRWTPKIAVFPGSFAPFHKGHLSVLKQAEQQFDKVVIAKGVNRQKTRDINEAEVRELKATLCHHQVDVYQGMLTDYLKDHYYVEDVTVIRGLRNGQDLQYEQSLRAALKDMEPNINIVYYICDADVAHVSSSLCREASTLCHPSYQKYTDLGNYTKEY